MASHQKNIKLNQSDNKHQKVAEKNDEKLVDDDDLDNVPHPLCIVIATKLQKRDIRELLSDDQRIALNVTEVNNPFKFWFHIESDELRLYELTRSMSEFYSNEERAKHLILKPEHVKIGQLVAAFYQQWDRAQIVQLPNARVKEVKVYHVDYGTVQTVPITDLRLLTSEFDFLPAMAIRGCLDQIRPIGTKFTFASTSMFFGSIVRKALFGKVTYVSEKKQLAYLKLVDVNRTPIIHINNSLVDAGHAVFIDQTAKTKQKRHCSEVYPSFEKLENGDYPTLAEVQQWKQEGFDFDAYEDSILIPEMKGLFV